MRAISAQLGRFMFKAVETERVVNPQHHPFRHLSSCLVDPQAPAAKVVPGDLMLTDTRRMTALFIDIENVKPYCPLCSKQLLKCLPQVLVDIQGLHRSLVLIKSLGAGHTDHRTSSETGKQHSFVLVNLA